LIERLTLRDVYLGKASSVLTKLVRNYRSHPDILALPSKLFYDNELVPLGDELITHSFSKWEHLPPKSKGTPMIFLWNRRKR